MGPIKVGFAWPSSAGLCILRRAGLSDNQLPVVHHAHRRLILGLDSVVRPLPMALASRRQGWGNNRWKDSPLVRDFRIERTQTASVRVTIIEVYNRLLM